MDRNWGWQCGLVEQAPVAEGEAEEAAKGSELGVQEGRHQVRGHCKAPLEKERGLCEPVGVDVEVGPGTV